jgi:hypothetical protein
VLHAAITVSGGVSTALFENHSATCSYPIGLAVYKRLDSSIDTQELYNYVLAVIPPGSALTLTVANPPCAFQVDAFWGPVLFSLNGQRYGSRLLDDVSRTNSGYCTPRCVPPSPPPGPPAVLVGHVTWEGRPAQPDPANRLPITLTLQLGAGVTRFPNQLTDASGVFTVPVDALPAGVYTWRADGASWLVTEGTTTLTGAPETRQEMGRQLAGDVNDDNLVDIVDFSLLQAGFGRACGQAGYDERADFTGDCLVDIADFALLRANFGRAGAQRPTGP